MFNSSFNSYVEATYLKRYTHDFSKVKNIPIHIRIQQYNQQCAETFRAIPHIEIVSSKDNIPENSTVIHISNRRYAIVSDDTAYLFILKFIATYEIFLKTKTPERQQQIRHAYPVTTLLKDLQKIRASNTAIYSELKKIIPSSHLKLLIEMNVLRRIDLRYMNTRESLIIFHF